MITGRFGYGSYDPYVSFEFQEMTLVQKCQHTRQDFDHVMNVLMNQDVEECWDLAEDLWKQFAEKWYPTKN